MKRSDSKRRLLWAPARTDRDLDRFWRAAMEPLGFGARRFWVTVFGPDGEPTGVMINVDDVPLAIDDDEADAMMHAFGSPLLGCVPGGTLAMLFCRPGRNSMTTLDRRLAQAVTRAAARAELSMRPIYFANDVLLRVFAADDLLPSTPAEDRQ